MPSSLAGDRVLVVLGTNPRALDILPAVTRPTDSPSEAADVRVPPPAIYGAGMLLGFVLGAIWPMHPPGGAIGVFVGVVMLLGSLALGGWSIVHMRATGQDPRPWKPTPILITDGPYAWSRNPIYLAMSALCVGVGLIAGNSWVVGMVVPVVQLVERFVIVPEERYLEQRFEEAYRIYARSVRRWI